LPESRIAIPVPPLVEAALFEGAQEQPEVFAALVRDRLEDADWDTRRDVIRTLVRRIEIDGQHVRAVFRVDPGPQDGTGALRVGQPELGNVV
jgi:hypothetical protein